MRRSYQRALRFFPKRKFAFDISGQRHKEALEHEKAFWKSVVKQNIYASMQDNWKKVAAHFQDVARRLMPLDETKNILQIGGAVQDAIDYWTVGSRFSVDPLAVFYKQQFGLFDPAINYVVGLGEYLPIRPASIDVIICLNVLDHVMNPGRVLSECHRVLRPPGVFFLGVDTFPDEPFEGSDADPIHFWRFSAEDIARMVTRSRFNLIDKNVGSRSGLPGASWCWLVASRVR